MDSEKIVILRRMLDDAAIAYDIIRTYTTIRTADAGVENGFGTLVSMAPTFILVTEKGPLSAIISGDRRISYKKIKLKLGLKNVSLATPDQVNQITGANVGEVSLVNQKLKCIMDGLLYRVDAVYGGCGEPNYTLRINPQDLAKLNHAEVFDFTEAK
jgi:Cys-tRNA(Pro)/Cys-tRNA(Cys) deacylase